MSQRSRPIATLVAGLLLAPAALAHEQGGSAAGEVGHGAPGASRTIAIVERADGTMAFSPDALRVRRGETIRFDVTNDGRAAHEFRIDTVVGNAEHASMMRAMPGMTHHDGNSITLAPGSSGHLTWRFTRAGTFQFACLIPGHFEAGMHGVITVER